MDASKYLTGMELQSVSIQTDQEDIPGYELKLNWVEVAQPDKPRTGEPFLIDEESLISLIDALRNQIRQIQQDEGRPGDLPH